MPDSPRHNRHHLNSPDSRLDRTLLRLHGKARETVEEESLSAAWHQAWTTRRDRIARRLEMIETQLERLMRAAAPLPHFPVVAHPPDADEMTATGPA